MFQDQTNCLTFTAGIAEGRYGYAFILARFWIIELLEVLLLTRIKIRHLCFCFESPFKAVRGE